MKLELNKKHLDLYWKWKLGHVSLLNIVEHEKIPANKLYYMFKMYDYKFQLENWNARESIRQFYDQAT